MRTPGSSARRRTPGSRLGSTPTPTKLAITVTARGEEETRGWGAGEASLPPPAKLRPSLWGQDDFPVGM
jgi:hypothetical protein